MTYGKHMNSLQDLAQECWSADTIEAKREVLLKMIVSFKYKAKIPEFTAKANNADAKELDRLAANLAINNTDKVI